MWIWFIHTLYNIWEFMPWFSIVLILISISLLGGLMIAKIVCWIINEGEES